MLRMVVCSLWISTALAQAPAADPMAAEIQAVWASRQNSGHIDPAAREQARAALAEAPVASPMFASWAQTVSQFYGNGVQTRQVLEEALARTADLPKGNQTRRQLTSALADWWMQDRNLLRALQFAEESLDGGQAASAPAIPNIAVTGRAASQMGLAGTARMLRGISSGFSFQRLVDLYRQLGRPHETEAIVARLEASGADDGVLEQIYERQGQIDRAERVYKRQVEQAGDAQRSIGALQSLSMFYRRTDRFGDAIDTLQKAIAAATGSKPLENQRYYLRQEMASLLASAGRTDEADALHQQLLVDSRTMPGTYTQALSSYANYLADSKRGEQAEVMLRQYVDSAPLQPWEKANALYSLSNVAQRSGNTDKAQEYRKAASAIQEQQSANVGPAQGFVVTKMIADANAAMKAKKFDEAFALMMDAMAAAPSARDGFAVPFTVGNIANQLSAQKQRVHAHQLYDRLLSSMDGNTEPTQAEQIYMDYFRMLSAEKNWDDAARALERYRDVMIANHGPETGRLDQYYRSKVELAKSREALGEASAAAMEFLNYEIGLSGDTSEPYLSTLQFAAPVIEKAGRTDDALALYRREVKLVDLTTEPNDRRRANVRAQVALAFARAGQFDEAEDLARQAARSTEIYARNLQTVLQMKTAAVAAKQAPAK